MKYKNLVSFSLFLTYFIFSFIVFSIIFTKKIKETYFNSELDFSLPKIAKAYFLDGPDSPFFIQYKLMKKNFLDKKIVAEPTLFPLLNNAIFTPIDKVYDNAIPEYLILVAGNPSSNEDLSNFTKKELYTFYFQSYPSVVYQLVKGK